MEEGDINENLLRTRVLETDHDNVKDKIWSENKKMWVVAGPAIFTRFSTFGINVISQAFVGHIGATQLAAYALVFTLLTRFANGLLLGVASGMETLCGQACQIYLQAQSKNMIITYLAAFSLSIHIFLSWFLTVKYKFGINGAMVSTILAYWIPNIGQVIFVVSGGCRETWNGFTTLAFKDLWPVVKLSVTSGAMLCLELWYNAILILLTGNLKNAEVEIDALSICLNITGWEMMISLGFLAAASVRVSNELGKGDSKAAKFSILNIVITSLAIGFVLFIFFLLFRDRLAYIFTKDQDVAREVAYLSPLLAFSILLNSVQPVLSGVAIGAGWQSVVVYVTLGSYYLIGIPIGLVLGYVVKLQVEGVWIGMLIGTFVQTFMLVIITYRTDWDKQVSIAQRRVNKWFVEAEPSKDSNKSGAI
ncbi:hypothetical protein BUALT_Bualt12G0046700 [Buddleja alternifolia]|uniref:Protein DETOXIFICATION n=1 Tax=Buddleja alternifolia TaxID=168488 RepID=A0AAV6WZB7_9LAMI|nr:hypothetical protein BUALT_Bualt12G0046700 [Buddleja alternifolia]